MTDFQIVAVKKSFPEYDCSCITHVKTFGGTIWTRGEIIYSITQRSQFFVIDPKDGSRVYVMIADRQGEKYIRTKPNDTPNDNLLSLPTF